MQKEVGLYFPYTPQRKMVVVVGTSAQALESTLVSKENSKKPPQTQEQSKGGGHSGLKLILVSLQGSRSNLLVVDIDKRHDGDKSWESWKENHPLEEELKVETGEGLNKCEKHLPDEMLKFLENYLEQNLHRLDKSDGPSLIHRDFRPANIIVDEDNLKGIIDWSSARSSFVEEDFCALELGEWPIDESQKQDFFEGYASIGAVPEYQDVMPLLLVHRALAVVGFTVKKKTFQTIHSEPYQRNRKFLERVIKEPT